jgi:hypothetical protein
VAILAPNFHCFCSVTAAQRVKYSSAELDVLIRLFGSLPKPPSNEECHQAQEICPSLRLGRKDQVKSRLGP